MIIFILVSHNKPKTPAGASLQLVPNSKFSPRPICLTCLTCPTIAPTFPALSALSAFPAFPFLPPVQSFPLVPPVVPLVPLVSPVLAVPQFKIQNSQFPSHYLERIIGLKNAYLNDGLRNIVCFLCILLISRLLKI